MLVLMHPPGPGAPQMRRPPIVADGPRWPAILGAGAGWLIRVTAHDRAHAQGESQAAERTGASRGPALEGVPDRSAVLGRSGSVTQGAARKPVASGRGVHGREGRLVPRVGRVMRGERMAEFKGDGGC